MKCFSKIFFSIYTADIFFGGGGGGLLGYFSSKKTRHVLSCTFVYFFFSFRWKKDKIIFRKVNNNILFRDTQVVRFLVYLFYCATRHFILLLFIYIFLFTYFIYLFILQCTGWCSMASLSFWVSVAVWIAWFMGFRQRADLYLLDGILWSLNRKDNCWLNKNL